MGSRFVASIASKKEFIQNRMRKFLKDLLYNKGNENLDIARFCSLFANIAYWIAAAYVINKGTGTIGLVELGGGWAAVAAGSASWILARQIQENK